MSPLRTSCPPILSCAAAHDLEKARFAGEEAREWPAMQAAGSGIASAVLTDFQELGTFPDAARLLVLVGKGHNGGDALIAAQAILRRHTRATADVLFVFGERSVRPLTAQAWRELVHESGDRLRVVSAPNDAYDVGLDGVFGFQYRPPAEPRIAALIAAVNATRIGLRAAVDLPSADLFQADFTYATGSVKAPVLGSTAAGRIRYIDLGFFDGSSPGDATDRALTRALLDPLRALRPAHSDKRSYGHVFIVGGSRGFPGAVLMCASAAVRSGAGLVTVFAPESLAPAFAARLPEAIWVGWPETPAGGLALEGEHLLRERWDRADALVVGPGVGREPETLALLRSVVATSPVPVVIDADALQRDIVMAGSVARVITPHAGEYQRIAGEADLLQFSADPRLTVVLKGPVTRVCDGESTYYSLFGGPVLARGGSGDLLAGMIGTQLAQLRDAPALAAARAVVWHGLAADELARAHGPVAVATTQLLEHLDAVLRSG